MAKNTIDEIVVIEEKNKRRAELLQVSTAVLSAIYSNPNVNCKVIDGIRRAEFASLAINQGKSLLDALDDEINGKQTNPPKRPPTGIFKQ